MTARATRSTVVEAPIGDVWATLADFGGLSRWGGGVSHSSLLSKATEGLGAVRRVQVGRNTLRESVAAWDPPLRLAYDITGLPPVVRRARNTWSLQPAAGGTEVRLTSEVDTVGPPVVAKLVARRLAAASDQLLAGLSAHLHGRTSA